MQLSHILASPGLQYEYPFSVTSETGFWAKSLKTDPIQQGNPGNTFRA